MYRWAGWSIGSSLPLSAQCVLAAIDSGHAQRALETGTMPVMAFVMGLRELPEGTRDALFEDLMFGVLEHYQTFVMSHPALYALHQFRARSNAELRELPRDIERLYLRCYKDAIAFELLGEFSNLTHLDLSCTRIGPDGVAALANSANLQRLTDLDLSCNQIGNKGVAALARSANMQHLTHLNLGYTQIGADGVAALASSTNLQRLTHLNLGHNQIGDEEAAVLTDSANLQRLTHLGLRGNRIGYERARRPASGQTSTTSS